MSAFAVDLGVVLPVIVGIAWSVKAWLVVGRVRIDGHPQLLALQDSQARGRVRVPGVCRYVAGPNTGFACGRPWQWG